MSSKTLLFCTVLLAGCAANAPSGGASSSAPAPFSLVTYSPTPEQQQKLAQLELRYESGYYKYPMDPSLELSGMVNSNPDAAKFEVEHRIAEGIVPVSGGDLRQRSLRTLIQSGQFQYLDRYWQGVNVAIENPYVYSQGAVVGGGRNPDFARWFRISFALAASAYVAAHDSGAIAAYEQSRLVNYYRQACLPREKLLGSCQPHDDLVARYFMLYQLNPQVATSDAIVFAKSVADDYLQQQRYDVAAGWYAAVISLTANTDTRRGYSQTIDDAALVAQANEFYHWGMTLDEVIGKAQAMGNQQYQEMLKQCRGRLELIRAAGVQTIPAMIVASGSNSLAPASGDVTQTK